MYTISHMETGVLHTKTSFSDQNRKFMFKSKINLQLEIVSLQVQSSDLHENYFVNFNQSERETKFVYFNHVN